MYSNKFCSINIKDFVNSWFGIYFVLFTENKLWSVTRRVNIFNHVKYVLLLYNIAKYMHLSSQWWNKNDWQIYIHPTAISMAESTLLFRWPIFVFNLIIIILKKYFFFFPMKKWVSPHCDRSLWHMIMSSPGSYTEWWLLNSAGTSVSSLQITL